MHQIQPLLTYDQLRAEFARLIETVCYILDKSPNLKRNLQRCKRFCVCLKTSNNTNSLLYNETNCSKINESKNFSDLFDIIKQHISWDEHFILTEIIDVCGSAEAEQEFNKYKRKMAISNALEIISLSGCIPPAGFEKFCVIIDKPYTKLTIEKYEEIKMFIFDNLDVHRYVSNKFIRVLFDSLHLEWHVTMQAVPHMVEMAYKHRELFINNLFVVMEIGEEVIIRKYGKNKKPVSLAIYM